MRQALNKIRGSVIEAIEYVYPERKITNEDLQNEFPDYDFLKFEKKVGIESRFVVTDNETGLDLAIRACKKLFSRINTSKEKIDFVCGSFEEYEFGEEFMFKSNTSTFSFSYNTHVVNSATIFICPEEYKISFVNFRKRCFCASFSHISRYTWHLYVFICK